MVLGYAPVGSKAPGQLAMGTSLFGFWNIKTMNQLYYITIATYDAKNSVVYFGSLPSLKKFAHSICS